jgi:hypothetical protein
MGDGSGHLSQSRHPRNVGQFSLSVVQSIFGSFALNELRIEARGEREFLSCLAQTMFLTRILTVAPARLLASSASGTSHSPARAFETVCQLV